MQLGEFVFDSEVIGLLKEVEGTVDRLITILSIPKKEFSTRQVVGALKLSHSSLRGSKGKNSLVYYGAKLGDAADLGVCVTVKDEVKEIDVNGVVYLNR